MAFTKPRGTPLKIADGWFGRPVSACAPSARDRFLPDQGLDFCRFGGGATQDFPDIFGRVIERSIYTLPSRATSRHGCLCGQSRETEEDQIRKNAITSKTTQTNPPPTRPNPPKKPAAMAIRSVMMATMLHFVSQRNPS
jgi:hypothetical protein